MAEETPSGGRTITCECDTPTLVYPPTSDYKVLLPEPCPKGDSLKGFFDCENCDKRTFYHWDKGHIVSSKPDYEVNNESQPKFKFD